MNHLFTFFHIISCSYSGYGFAQDNDTKTYNYMQIFKMIEAEKDTIYCLWDVVIAVDPTKDQRFYYEALTESTDSIEPVSYS